MAHVTRAPGKACLMPRGQPSSRVSVLTPPGAAERLHWSWWVEEAPGERGPRLARPSVLAGGAATGALTPPPLGEALVLSVSEGIQDGTTCVSGTPVSKVPGWKPLISEISLREKVAEKFCL